MHVFIVLQLRSDSC